MNTKTCEFCCEPFHFDSYTADVFCGCDRECAQSEARAVIDGEFDRLAADAIAVAVDQGGTREYPW